MITHGTVINKANNISKVKIGSKEGCNACGRCGKYRNKIVTALDLTDSSIGDEVRVEICDKKYLLSILLLYVVPFLSFVFGVLVGYYMLSCNLSANLVDMVSVACGIITLSVSYLVIWLYKSKIDKKTVAKVMCVIN